MPSRCPRAEDEWPLTPSADDHLLAEQIAEELLRRILAGEIPRGSKLRQDTVAAEFQVSRTPIREAFRALHGQGVLEIVPRRGAIVHGVTPRDILENNEVRAELEAFAAELAASRIDDAQLERLRDATERFAAIAADAQGDDAAERWRDANGDFHTTIVAAAGNPHLTTSIKELRRQIPHNLAFVTLAGNTRLIRQNADEHAAIFKAIEEHDGKLARRLVRKHVLHAAERIARRYEDDQVRGPERSARRRI